MRGPKAKPAEPQKGGKKAPQKGGGEIGGQPPNENGGRKKGAPNPIREARQGKKGGLSVGGGEGGEREKRVLGHDPPGKFWGFPKQWEEGKKGEKRRGIRGVFPPFRRGPPGFWPKGGPLFKKGPGWVGKKGGAQRGGGAGPPGGG